MKKLTTAVLVWLPLLLAGQANTRVTDSLLENAASAPADTNKVILLDNLAYNYSGSNPTEGIKYALQAEALAKELKWTRGIARANLSMALNYMAKADHIRSMEYFQKALHTYKSIHDKRGEAATLANIGLFYMGISDYPNALTYNLQALAIREELGEGNRSGIIRENIGTIYQEQKNYPKAFQYYSQALEAYTELKDNSGAARALGNIGILENARGNYQQGLKYHLKALEANTIAGNQYSMQVNMANVAISYTQLKDYGKALEYQFRALKLSEDLDQTKSIAINQGNLGETYYFIGTDSLTRIAAHPLIKTTKEQNLREAANWLEKATDLCEEIKFSGPLAEFGQYLSNVYFSLADYKRSVEKYRHFVAIRDSVYSQENTEKLARLEMQHETELRNKAIILKNKKIEIAKLATANKGNERLVYLLGIAFLLAVIFIVVRKFVRRNRAHYHAMSEIAQIQSHEVRGPVARLLGLSQLFNHEDPADPINEELVKAIRSVTLDLDQIIKKIIQKTSA